MLRSDFHYELPDELIARHPAARRSDSRLLHLDGASRRAGRPAVHRPAAPAAPRRPAGVQRHARDPGAPARPQGDRRPGRDAARARASAAAARWCSCARASRRRPGSLIRLPDGATADRRRPRRTISGCSTSARILPPSSSATARCRCRRTCGAPAERRRPRALPDRLRARARAPWRRRPPGLHFDAALLAPCRRRPASQRARVTLHVGAGTFQPVRVDDLAEHRDARRALEVPPATVRGRRALPRARRARRRRRAPRSVRALESRRADGERCAPVAGDTRLFITPGLPLPRRGRAGHQLPPARVDAADAGLRLRRPRAGARAPTRHAVAARYRFFSYGDAMFVEPRPGRARATGGRVKFDLLAHRRRGAPRPPHAAPRRRRDAGLHARRHLRHGQGHDARGARRDSARRSCSATPST